MNDKQIVSKINGYLFSAARELCAWLNNMLPRVTDEWWQECVLSNLSYAQRNIAVENGYTSLDQFDLAALLRITDKSWYDMRSFASLPTAQRKCVRAMMRVRNNWAHIAGGTCDKDVVIHDLEIILEFFETVIVTNRYTDSIREFKHAVETADFSAVYSDSTEQTAAVSQLPAVPDFDSQPDLTTKADIADYYTNVKLSKVKGKIFVPCGVGTTDNGFYICGIKEDPVSSAPAVFALVYNYLTRNSTILPEDYPHYLKRISTTYQLNYQRVYRLMIIILQLVKNKKVSSKLNISYDGKPEELQIAVDIINDYVCLFSRLIKVKPIILTIAKDAELFIKVSLDKKVAGIYVENKLLPCNARELWFSEKINYQLSTEDIRDLEYILREISPFDSFKEGQFPALTSMLNTSGHSMCIMPTGSGKSLIFYLASLLQPLPIMILAPTEILIDDQIRNLKKFHHMDNVSHLKLTVDNDFSEFYPCTSLMYLTPITFQSVNLLKKCRHINDGYAMVMNKNSGFLQEVHVAPGPSLAYVVLDEVHCLSNWGHDFRPEYLMLSKHLNTFLSRISFLGFTATANYTVVEDIQKQLNIPQQNIISPITFEKYNISYDFRDVSSVDEMISVTCEIVAGLIRRNERTLIFTKSEEMSARLAEAIGFEADVFEKDNTSAYHMFAEEKCKVLVASEDMGIGINLPNIQNVIHFGLPISKNEYVQEIGRAGRADEAVTSYVVYLRISDENIPSVLLSREEKIPEMESLLKRMDNDYAECFRKLTNNVDSQADLLNKVMAMYREFSDGGKASYVKTYSLDTVDLSKKYIYMLYVLGYVNNWYAYSGYEKSGTIAIMIDISSNNHFYYSIPANMLQRVQQRAVAYYDSLGGNREQIVRTQRAKDLEAVIKVYVEWYYSKFLYHHKELFLDCLDFIDSNRDSDNVKITEEIQEYFTLPFVEIKSDEIYYTSLSLSDIGTKVAQGIGRKTLANIERINGNRYSFNLDCMILLGTLKLDSRFDANRFDRIIKNASKDQTEEFRNAFLKIYEKLTPHARLIFIQGIDRKTLANIERINGNRYSFNLDCMILLGTLKLDSRFDANRFDRIIKNASKDQTEELRNAFMKIYDKLTPHARLIFIRGVVAKPTLFGNTVEAVCTALYQNNSKDIVYYGFMAQRLNKCFA